MSLEIGSKSNLEKLTVISLFTCFVCLINVFEYFRRFSSFTEKLVYQTNVKVEPQPSSFFNFMRNYHRSVTNRQKRLSLLSRCEKSWELLHANAFYERMNQQLITYRYGFSKQFNKTLKFRLVFDKYHFRTAKSQCTFVFQADTTAFYVNNVSVFETLYETK